MHPARHFRLGRGPSVPGVVLGHGAVRGGRIPWAVRILGAALSEQATARALPT